MRENLLYIPILAFAMAIGFAGCANQQPSQTGNHIASADRHVTTVIPHVTGDDKAELNAAHADLGLAAQSATVDTKQAAENKAELTKLQGKWYVRWGQRIEGLFWTLVIALVLGLILRGASMFAGGWIGSVMSIASTGIFGVLSGGVSLIQSLFDNLWFRKMSPAVQANKGGSQT